MTAAQQMLYFREWGRVRDVLKAKGLPCGDVARHGFHKKALGVAKSSKLFTNADLDRVLAEFRAITQPDNLQAQLQAIESPERRLGKLQAECWKLVYQLPKLKAAELALADVQFYAENYLNTLAKSLRGVPFEKLDEVQCAKLLGILRHRLGKAGAPGAREKAFTERDSGDESVPF